MIDFFSGIAKLYPQVAVIREETAYDKDGNEVAYDRAAVQAYVDANCVGREMFSYLLYIMEQTSL